MMTFRGLTLQRGDLRLLENTSVSLHSGWKVGLTGANGSGKSSLFKLLLGELTLDAGELQMSGYDRIAHMAQEVAGLTQPAIDYVLEGHQELKAVELGLIEAEASGDDHRLAELHGQFDLLQGYSKRAEAEQLLAGLGFPQDTFNNPVNSFSGGWRIRLNLARTLFMPSDLLLLDEPTNHLDLDATLWLESWLRGYPGTLLLISHDRDFLDNVVDHLLHVEARQLNLYKGGYSAFERQRAERLAQQQSMFEKQQREVAHMEDFIRRFKAKASKAKQAQSRIKALERMEKIAPAHVDSPFHFLFPEASQSSDPLLVMRDATLGYPNKSILRQVGFTLHPGQRIGLLGPNGAGKSTLIKSLVGDLLPVTGQRTAGEHLYIGYFAQHQLEALDVNATPLLHLQRLSPDAREQELRNFLGGFGFQGDEVLSLVSRFSGGEKARLALAMIAWQKPNLLLLDEPTNHLDLEMRHALTLALQEFSGAVMVVSHDRHLLSNTVDEYWLVVDGGISNFEGDLEDYARWLKERQAAERRVDKSRESSAAEQSSTNAVNKKMDRKEAARLREQLKPLKNRVNKLEQQMDQARASLTRIEEALAETSLYSDAGRKVELQSLLKDQGNLQQQVDALEMEWLEASEELENRTAALGL